MSSTTTVAPGVHHLAREDGDRLAVMASAGEAPGVLILGDLGARMEDGLPHALAAHTADRGHATTRFDYFGHGQSDGLLEQGTIGIWRDNAIVVLEEETSGPQILVGIGLGGWLALLVALERPERIAGLLLLAPAVDFTEHVASRLLGPEERQKLEAAGRVKVAGVEGGAALTITSAMVGEGRRHLLVARGALDVRVPVRIVQGQRDALVSWQETLGLAEQIAGDDVTVSLIRGGGHRLDRPGDLAVALACLDALLVAAASRPGEQAS